MLLAALGVSASGARAVVPTTPLTTESFAGASTAGSGWFLPSRASNSGCLTAGTDVAQMPVPACASTPINPAGSGALRLTRNVGNAVGTVYNTTSLPSSQGLDIQFNTYQWNATTNPGADGIAFILAATDPTNPAPPANPGPLGGSLGYSATRSNSAPGVSYGYLGFGLDVYGNFEGSGFGGTDCPASSRVQQSITVRGPGNDNLGYCVLDTTQVTSGALDDRTGTTRPAPVPVEIAINPGSATTTASGVSVPADSWMIQVTPLGGSTVTRTGPLPSAARLAALGFPSSYVDGVSGLPQQLTFGWAASTGGSTETHAIDTMRSTTLSGQVPVLSVAVSDDEAGHLVAGNHAVLTVDTALAAGQGSESQPITVTTMLPPGLTPTQPTAAGYSCTVSGQLVSCVYAPASALTPGSSLPPLTIPVDVGAAATGSYTISAKASSADALPATTSHQVSVTAFVAQANPASSTYGDAVTLATNGLPSGAAGTVAFSTGGTPLCSVTMPSYSCAVPGPLPVGTYPVTATYSGDTTYVAQTTSTTFTVGKAATAVTAQAAAATVTYGADDPITAGGLPSGATGTLTFSSGSDVLCTTTLPEAVCLPGSLPVGETTVHVTYSGDGNHLGSTDAVTVTVTKLATTLVAAVSDSSVEFGAPPVLSVTGLAVGSNGTVRFEAGGVLLCTASLPDTSCTPDPALEVADYPVTATYSGDPTHEAATDDTAFEVVKASTAVVVATSAAQVPAGTAPTLSVSGLPAGATGTVTLTSGTDTLCVITLPATSCQPPADLAVATYPVVATYSGDAHYTGSDDDTTFDVALIDAAAFAASANPAATVYGNPDTLSFSGVDPAATGSVTFTSGGTTLCVALLPATSCQTPADLVVATYPVTATYVGDLTHAAATATTTFDVVKAPVVLDAGVAASQVSYGSAQTLSFSGVPAGAQGSVTFSAGGAVLCTVTLPGTSCAAPADVPVGDLVVQAVYSGDANHEAAQTSTGYAVVRLATQVLAAVAHPATPYAVADTVLQSGLPADATGTVTFRAGGRVLCVATLPASSCDAPADLAVGTHHVVASYSGDARYEPSQDATLFAVTKLSTRLSASATPQVAVEGTQATLSATGLPATATGTIRFATGGQTLCVATLPATSCVATAALQAGPHGVRATYSGDAVHDGSSARTSYRRTAQSLAQRSVSTPVGSPVSVPVPTAPGGVPTVVAAPSHGSVVVQDGVLVYTPSAGFTGTDTATVEVTDTLGNVRAVAVTFTVLAGSTTSGSGTPDVEGTSVQLSRLPRTGGLATGPLALGLSLIVLGGLAVAWSRRREV
ncbi:hypothetical protein GCM10023145_39130 [Angustibacter luteus]